MNRNSCTEASYVSANFLPHKLILTTLININVQWSFIKFRKMQGLKAVISWFQYLRHSPHSTCAPCAWHVPGHCCPMPPCSPGTHLPVAAQPRSQTMQQEQHCHITTFWVCRENSPLCQDSHHGSLCAEQLSACSSWHPSTQLLGQHGGAVPLGSGMAAVACEGASRLSVAGDSIRTAAPESPLCNLASSGWLRTSRTVSSGNFLDPDLVGICSWGGHASP